MKVIGVTQEQALAWAVGEIHDEQLRPALTPQAVFIADFGGRQEYPAVLAACADLSQAGAVCLIARTLNPVVARHMERNGCILVSVEKPCGDRRYLAPPAALRKWLAKFTRRGCQDSGHLIKAAHIQS